MKYFIYWFFYYSSQADSTYHIAGAVYINTEINQVTTYVANFGLVTWNIKHIEIYPDEEVNTIKRGIIVMDWYGISSTMLISSDAVIQFVGGIEKIILIKNKYAYRRIHPWQVPKIKRKGTVALRRTQQGF